MCHAAHIRLTAAEKKEVKKLWGVLAPVYASIALILVAGIVVTHLPRSGEAVAVAKTETPTAPAR